MDFQCFQCSEAFENVNNIIEHLKKIHFYRDNFKEISCVVRHSTVPRCKHTFRTFSNLRKHVVKCLEERNQVKTTIQAIIYIGIIKKSH